MPRVVNTVPQNTLGTWSSLVCIIIGDNAYIIIPSSSLFCSQRHGAVWNKCQRGTRIHVRPSNWRAVETWRGIKSREWDSKWGRNRQWGGDSFGSGFSFSSLFPRLPLDLSFDLHFWYLNNLFFYPLTSSSSPCPCVGGVKKKNVESVGIETDIEFARQAEVKVTGLFCFYFSWWTKTL